MRNKRNYDELLTDFRNYWTIPAYILAVACWFTVIGMVILTTIVLMG